MSFDQSQPPPSPPGGMPPPPPGAPPPPPGGGFSPPPGAYGQQFQGGYGQQMGSFFIQRMGQEEGPYAFGDLGIMAKSGSLRTSTMVRRADAQNWFPAGDIPGLYSDKDWTTAAIISLLLGGLGIDRFYLGYSGLGILKLITCGGCGIWSLIDLILIATNKVPDANGRPLRRA